MKRLIILRHGKSSWSTGEADVDRPLLSRGYEDALIVSQNFKKQTDYLFTIWSSKAKRAKTTAAFFNNALQSRVEEFKVKDEFYTFDVNELLQLIHQFPNRINNMMLVGHNPALTQLLNYFCLGSNIYNLPTTGLAELIFDNDDWYKVDTAKLNLLLLPKKLKPY